MASPESTSRHGRVGSSPAVPELPDVTIYLERLAALGNDRGGEGAVAHHPPMAYEEVRDFFFARQNHIAELDDAAEQCAADWGLLPGRADEALAQRLLAAHGVRVVDVADLPGQAQRVFQAEAGVLQLAAGLERGQRVRDRVERLERLEREGVEREERDQPLLDRAEPHAVDEQRTLQAAVPERGQVERGRQVEGLDAARGGELAVDRDVEVVAEPLDLLDLDRVAAAIGPRTRLMWLESPGNPLLSITDLAAKFDMNAARRPATIMPRRPAGTKRSRA